MQDSLIISISGKNQFISLSGHCYFVLSSFIKLYWSPFSYKLLILSYIYFASQYFWPVMCIWSNWIPWFFDHQYLWKESIYTFVWSLLFCPSSLFLGIFYPNLQGPFSYNLLILSRIMLRMKILMILNIMITMIIMMIMVIRKIDIPDNVFEEPLLVKNLNFWHLLIYMYTIPNISFFVHCRLLPRIDDVKL